MGTNNYNSIINLLNQFADNHLSLKRFSVSFFEQMDNFSTANNSFPILYVTPNDVSFEENIDEISFRAYCIDILKKDRSNEKTILNETLLILRDLTNWIRLNTDLDINIVGTPRAIPVNNFLVDFTIGWYIDFTIETSTVTTDCAIPFSDNFSITGMTCDISYVRPYLTCDTLDSCQGIIDINTSITNLESIVYRTNQLISGGASFLSGLTYDVTPLEYLIEGVIYTTPLATTVTTSSGDTTYDRIDLIIADINGNVTILEGTPSDNPVQPDVDESSQIVVAIITVPAGATAIPVQETLIYNEDVGLPTEWNGSVTSGTIDLAYTGITYNGTKSLRFNLTPNAAYAQFDSGTNFDTSVQNTIQFWIYNTVAWTSAHRLNIRLRNAANALVGSVVQLYNARYGFSATASSVGVWQLVSIPIADFNLTSPIIGRIDFQAVVTSGIGFSCIIDVVKFVEGASNASQTNKWWFVRGNTATTIIPTTTNSTLRLAGGSNINTYASGTNFINFDLNTTLTGLTSVSATTFYGDGSNLTGINIPGGYWTGGTGTNSIISLNQGHTASGNNSFIGGGYNNQSNGGYSAVVGGKLNINNGTYSSVIGGYTNQITVGYQSFIGGGISNIVSNSNSSIIGGTNNTTSGSHSFIGGGDNNNITNYNSVIAGGANNNNLGGGSLIGSSKFSQIQGGYQNTILGGTQNIIQTATYNTSIIGGSNNTINTGGYFTSIIGGSGNIVGAGYSSSVIGGSVNLTSGDYSAVIAGTNNTASGDRTVVIGGQNITGSANDTTYVPYLNIGSLSATTTATTYENLVINNNGDVMTNNQFYIGVNFTVTGVTWDYVALNTFSIYSIDNPSSIGYSLLHNGTAYTLNNIINLYDDLQITGVTATGVLKLNATL